MKPLTTITAATFWARIYMAGSLADAERACRRHCFSVGLCVTVTPTKFIYTGGEEAGFVVGLINYPRFPKLPEEIEDTATALGLFLMQELDQHSFSIETPRETTWHSRRPGSPA